MGNHDAYSDFDMNQPTFLTTASAGRKCSGQWQQLVVLIPSELGRQVRLQEPQVLVQAPGDLREQVGRVDVPE